jgi:hypothetical protein
VHRGHYQRRVHTSAYEEAFHRIRAEYVEMPGMRLTPQLERLTGVGVSVCRAVLDDLVRARFLRLTDDGTYLRAADDKSSGSNRSG